jgi:hypothetical protein
MSTVYKTFEDLKEFGIIFLTGEACKMSMRLLCDLTPQGAEVISDYLGGNVKFTEGSNWNHGATCSVLIPRNSFADLAAFCLIRRGDEYAVVFKNGSVQSMTEEYLLKYRGIEGWYEENVVRIYSRERWPSNQGNNSNLQNKHQMTGRTQ